jgi:hypothetical protein
MFKIFNPDDSLHAESEAAYAMDRGAWCFLHVVLRRRGPRLPLPAVAAHVNHTHLRRVLPRGRALT